MHFLIGFLFLNFVFNAFEFDAMKPLGYRMFMYRQYFDENIANPICCNNLCTQDNIDLIYSMSIIGNVTMEIQGTIRKNSNILNINHVKDINHENLYNTDNYKVVFKLICKDSLVVLSETVKHNVHIYPYGGLIMIGDNTGSNKYSKIDAAIKGICPGRAGPSCKKICAETEKAYCDHITGDFVCKNGKFGFNCDSTIQYCSLNPCGNNGQCLDQEPGYKCICNEMSTGDHCQYPVCNEKNCKHGTCDSDGQCICESGYTGRSCNEIKENDAICNMRGNLVVTKSALTSKCDCMEGYYGDFCEITCVPVCSNGEKCLMDRDSPRCIPTMRKQNTDTSGLKASNTKCDHNFCQNGGYCIETSSGPTCRCTSPWVGFNCKTSICTTRPCVNGVCLDGTGCLCHDGYSGEACLIPTCQSYKKCLNGGRCIQNMGYLDCECDRKMHAGPNCQYRCLKRCQRGTCELTDGTVRCLCEPGFSGEDCSMITQNICLPSTCLHGGICSEIVENGVPTFNCSCAESRTGKRCELSTCSQNECLKGICIDEYGCQCINNYSGEKCDIPTCPSDNSICAKPEQCYVAGNQMFCKCHSKQSVGLRCEHECKPACNNNGECAYVNGLAQCVCFAGLRGKNCDEFDEIPTEPASIRIYALVIAILIVLIIIFAGVIARSRFTRELETIKNIMSHAARTMKEQKDAIYGRFTSSDPQPTGLYATIKVAKDPTNAPLY